MEKPPPRSPPGHTWLANSCRDALLHGVFLLYTLGDASLFNRFKRKVAHELMIRHEIILRIKPHVNREIIDRTLQEVREHLREIPGVERVRSGVNNTPAYRHAMLVIDLTDELALHRFGRHPQHARALRLIGRLAESSAVGSYHLGAEERQG